MKNKTRKIISLMLVVALLLTSFSACSKKDEKTIETKIESFVTAYNNGSFEDVLATLDTKTRATTQAMFNMMGSVAGGLTGIDFNLSDMFNLGVNSVSGDYISVEIKEIKLVDDENAIITTDMTIMNEKTNAFFVMVFENDDWYISDITNQITGASQDVTSENINITKCYRPSVDIALIEYTKDGKEYSGLINMDGKIFFSMSKTAIDSYYGVGNGAAYIREYSTDDAYIINSNGDVVASSKEGDFDDINGCGNGKVIVFKENSDISKVSYIYGVIDAETGKLDNVMETSKKIVLSNKMYYLGNDLYCGNFSTYGFSGKKFSNAIFYNIKLNKYFGIYECDYIEFTDGKLYCNPTQARGNVSSYYKFIFDSDSEIPINTPVLFSADGTFEEALDYDYVGKDIMVKLEEDNIKIYNKNNNSVIEFNDYPITDVFGIYDNNIFIEINGADGVKYFTLIDSKGKERFKPIPHNGDKTFYKSGLISYVNLDEEAILIDINGNEIISSDTGYTDIDGSGYMFLAQSANGELYLDANGKPIEISL